MHFNYDDSRFCFQYKFQGPFPLETAFISGSLCIIQDSVWTESRKRSKIKLESKTEINLLDRIKDLTSKSSSGLFGEIKEDDLY